MESGHATSSEAPFVAVVAGATGATGRWIVCELINRPECEKVFALTRSDINPNDMFPSADKEKMETKLVVKKIDWSSLKTSNSIHDFEGSKPTVGFCAMGSAPYTEESDYTLPVAFGNACKNAGVSSMFLVSAVGSKAGSFFGYVDTLGRREEAFKGMNFQRLGIYRPMGMLRQDRQRTKESFFSFITPSSMLIDTREIAKVMVDHAISMKAGVNELSHSDMKKHVK